jgi:hypothetical protein
MTDAVDPPKPKFRATARDGVVGRNMDFADRVADIHL